MARSARKRGLQPSRQPMWLSAQCARSRASVCTQSHGAWSSEAGSKQRCWSNAERRKPFVESQICKLLWLSYRPFRCEKMKQSSTTSMRRDACLSHFKGLAIPGCKGTPSTSCVGCTRDVRGIVFVCKPSTGRQCWNILHQARARNLVDDQRNAIERPSLIKKRKRNSSLGVERVPKRLRKSLALNPHHAQLNWKHINAW